MSEPPTQKDTKGRLEPAGFVGFEKQSIHEDEKYILVFTPMVSQVHLSFTEILRYLKLYNVNPFFFAYFWISGPGKLLVGIGGPYEADHSKTSATGLSLPFDLISF